MRILVIGSGAMGSTFGAHFARAGAQVTLYDRDADHVDAINAEGLRVTTPDGDIDLRLPAIASLDDAPPADIALFLVDSNATASAATEAASKLSPETTLFTLQNGIGNIEALSDVFGESRVIGGCTYNSAARLVPGRVLHSNIGETTIGEIDGASSERITAVADLFRKAGLPVDVSSNVLGHVWMKFVLNAAINPLSAMTGLRPGEIARTESARLLLEDLLDEILAVVDAKGIVLPDDNARQVVLDHAFDRYNRPSMLQHVEQGRQTEIDALNGALLREAHRLGIPCPVNETVVRTIKSIEARNAARAADPEVDEAKLEAAARREREMAGT